MFGWLPDLFGIQARREVVKERAARERALVDLYQATDRYKQIRARYDNAQTNKDNADLWRWTDALSARGANDLATRKVLRERARYEVVNNSHARGITLTYAMDMVGTGPRYQCLYEDIRRQDDENEAFCDAIESAWSAWANEVGLDEKLLTYSLTGTVDGEAFFLLTTDESLTSPVKLNLRALDCDLFTDRRFNPDARFVDGIEIDPNEKPVAYNVLKQHPGDGLSALGNSDSVRIPAKMVIHWYRVDRPHQARGVSEITPALHIFGQLRRHTLAVLEAAELAADFAVYIQTAGTPETNPTVAAMSPTYIDKGMVTALPRGYQAFQLKPEQPTSTHSEFVKSLLREACHCLNIPYNVATADFENDSYSGGRMAQGVYQRSIEVRRKHLAARVLDRIFAAWLQEALLIDGYLPANTPRNAAAIPHTWFFDEWTHADPSKEANATQIELLTGVTNLAAECAKRGRDWRKEVKQQAKEINLKKQLGILILPPGTPPLDSVEPEKVAAWMQTVLVAVAKSEAAKREAMAA